MRLNSISFKLIGSMLLSTTVVLSGLGIFKYQEEQRSLQAEMKQSIELLFSRLQLNLPAAVWVIDDDYIASALSAEAKAKFVKGIYILDEKGRLLTGVQKSADSLEYVSQVPEGKSGLITETLRYYDSDVDEYYEVGAVSISTTDAYVHKELEAIVEGQVIQLLLLNGILLILFSVVVNRMTKPLDTLKKLAFSISHGSYDLAIDIKRHDEIGELADSFTLMKEGISKKIKDLNDLHLVSEQLANTSDLKQALFITLSALTEHVHADHGAVYWLYLETPGWDNDFKPLKDFALYKDIVGMTSKDKQTIYVPDSKKDERLLESIEHAVSHSVVSVPLMEKGGCIGVLTFTGKVGVVEFGSNDYEYADTIARQLVATLKSIRMLEEIEESNRNLEIKVSERTEELNQKNQDVQAMMHAAIEASKAKTEFLANMSHEIRTPMNGIIGIAQVLEKTDLDELQKDYVDTIRESGNTLVELINDILDFSKIEAGKVELEITHFDLFKLIKDVLNLYESICQEKGLEVIFEYQNSLPHSYCGDPLRIKQILINLISNAIKFTEQGYIKIEISGTEHSEDEYQLGVVVEDSGIGISGAEKLNLFDSFTQADTSTTRKYGGSGLGLAIVRALVELMEGNVSVESKEGLGTRFIIDISLPLSEQDSIPDQDDLSDIQLLSGTVLLVEDVALNQIVAESLLMECGLQVVIANDGIEALEQVETGDFDVILMDCQMPRMGGIEATRQIREKYSKDIPIVALTADVFSDNREKCLEAGMNDFVTKPFEFEDLYKVLRRWMRVA